MKRIVFSDIPILSVSFVVVFALSLAACQDELAACQDETQQTPTVTHTPLPATPSATIPLPTSTEPYPTLTVDQRLESMRELLDDNGGCQLPCWWGITPGQSSSTEIDELASQVGGFYFSIPHAERLFDYYVLVSFEQQDGSVEAIEVMVEVLRPGVSQAMPRDFRRYSPSALLTVYGEPSQVYVHLVPSIEPGAPEYYTLQLAYDELGILASYTGPATFHSDTASLCPRFDEVTFMLLRMTAPSAAVSVAEPPEWVATLEEATGMDIATFTQIFADADTLLCLETPADRWP